MKHWIKTISTGLFISAIMLSCSKDSENLIGSGNFAVKADLYGFKVVPTNSSIAAAFLTGSYNSSSNTFTYNLTYRDIVPTGVHIHRGSSMENGPVVFSLSDNGEINSGEIKFTNELESDLINGRLYIDVHSSFFADGEVRGQLQKE